MISAGGWTGAQFSLLRIAMAIVAFAWALAHWAWTPSLVLPLATLAMAAGWFTRWTALLVLVLAEPALSAAMPLFVLAPEGPWGSVLYDADDESPWRLSSRVLWISAIVTLTMIYIAWPVPDWGILAPAVLTLVPPGLIPGRNAAQVERLYYDGHCGLCHNFIRFLLSEDPEGRCFRFAALDSASFREHVPPGKLPDSVVVLTAANEVLTRSQAVLHVLHRLGGYWRILAILASPVPRPLLDTGYDFIASIRYRLFAKPADVCPLMPKDLRSRFEL